MNDLKILIICYVPEIELTNKGTMNKIADLIGNKFTEHFKKVNVNNSRNVDITKITKKDRVLVINELNKMAKHLKIKNTKGIIYYFGHGNNVRDISGDEKDGLDEIWETQNILDDEISKIFSQIDISSSLYLFSDSCSSGSMIDKEYNKKKWITISSANDRQDALATSEGGVFTMWGLLPALDNKCYTPKQIHNYIKKEINIDTQTSIINYPIESILNENIFM